MRRDSSISSQSAALSWPRLRTPRIARPSAPGEPFAQALHAPAHGFGAFDGGSGLDSRLNLDGWFFDGLGAGARLLGAVLGAITRRWALLGNGHLGLVRGAQVVGGTALGADGHADNEADEHRKHQGDDNGPRCLKE